MASDGLERAISTASAWLECAICFEPIKESTILPCSCKLDYCARCWNKALASSFIACGQGRCPSCRGFVRVDFDAEANLLVFSAEAQDMTFEHQVEGLRGLGQSRMDRSSAEALAALQSADRINALRNETIERLAQQAMPAQIRILEQFGTANPALLDMVQEPQTELRKLTVAGLKELITGCGSDPSGCLEKSDLIECLQKAASVENVLARWASATLPSPKCVCGSSLLRVTGLERFRRQLGDRISDEDFARMAEQVRVSERSTIICDLCDEHVKLDTTDMLWTCENGDDTILHATAYDICNDCFVRHSCGRLADSSSASPVANEPGIE